jgi:tyrosinase
MHMRLLRSCGLLLLAGAVALPQAHAQVSIEIEVNRTPDLTDDYVTWAPTFCRIRLVPSNPPPAAGVSVALESPSAVDSGEVLFAAAQTPWPVQSTATEETLALDLPANSEWREFVIAGKPGRPSLADKDAAIVARSGDASGTVVGEHRLMVRVRKNANTLTPAERDRFLSALARHNMVEGRYLAFQQIHAVAGPQAHEYSAFLPWHRTFILRLERELQAIDPSVALPYWRFDQAAPNLFHQDFMGASGGWMVDFAPTNPIAIWTLLGFSGINRAPTFGPNQTPPGVVDEDTALGQPASYWYFYRPLEGNPHGQAHVQAAGGGFLGNLDNAVRDPLFFLLHANVDRLWAKWQWMNDRFDTSVFSYHPTGATPPGGWWIGHSLNDTMWPWNGVTGAPRPPSAPGGPFPESTRYPAPSFEPRPVSSIDYLGRIGSEHDCGYCYDDVPFN